MRLQSRKSSCGPVSLGNALEALGLTRTEDELIGLCGQTTEGTTDKGLRKAIAAVGGLGTEIKTADAKVGMLTLLQALYEGRPVIVCVERWEHWATCVGILGFGKRIVCVDSGDNELVKVRSLDEFVEWWVGPDGASKPFYAVIV